MTKLVSLALAMLAMVLNIQADGPFVFYPDLALQGELAVPLIAWGKDVDMTNHLLYVDLMDNDDPFHCYTANEVGGLLNNVASSVRLYGNCVEAFDSDNCSGNKFTFKPDTPLKCLNYFIHCDTDMNDKISSFRICRP